MIREVEQKDIAECVSVIRKSFQTVADQLGFTIENAPYFTAFAMTEERLSYQFGKEHRPMYVFCDKGRIHGYYSLLFSEGNKCELNNLAVLPEYRHQGTGRRLLDHAFQVAKERGCSKLDISIVEENKVLRAWYEKNGFVHTGIEKFEFFPFTCGYMERRGN